MYEQYFYIKTLAIFENSAVLQTRFHMPWPL
jgi:hypothetical protein